MTPPILNARDVDDLRWFLLREHEGDVGVRSNFGPMLNRLEANASRKKVPLKRWGRTMLVHESSAWRAYDVDEAVLAAASRLRRLTWLWDHLAPEHRTTLSSLYAETRAPPREWGAIWWLVRTLPTARELHRKAKVKADLDAWLTRLPSRPAAALLATRLRMDADALVDTAGRAWLAAADAWRRRAREARRAS